MENYPTEGQQRRRIVSLWLPMFACDRASLAKSAQRSRAMAMVSAVHGGLRLAALNGPAAERGLVPGLTLAAARAVVPDLETAQADPESDARGLADLAHWCGRYTPWSAPEAAAEPAAGAGVWLDVTGCAHLFNGETALLDDLLTRVRKRGFAAQAALADSAGAAWGVARFGGREGVCEGGTIIPPDGQRRALKSLPLAALRATPAACEALDRLGLRQIGDLYDLPRAPLAARFGEALLKRLDQALGRAPEPISPDLPASVHGVRLAFPEPIGRLEDVAAGLDRLLERQELRLARERLGLRRAELALYRVDGGVARARIGTSRPVRDPGHLRRLFDERLDKLDLGFGVDVMTLMAPEVEALTAAQLEMAGPAAQAGQDSAQLAPLVDRLEVRLGRGSVVQLEQRASHIPERAQAPVPVFERAPITPEAAALMGAAANVSRPLRLFPRPQPVDAMAEVPDGPPVMFRWRRLLHRIVHAEGPERIAPEWWRDTAPPGQDRSHLTRDYYRIEDAEGRRFWVFREGLYDAVEPAVRPVTAPRWFLHGVFA